MLCALEWVQHSKGPNIVRESLENTDQLWSLWGLEQEESVVFTNQGLDMST